jgi:hypothetical protein
MYSIKPPSDISACGLLPFYLVSTMKLEILYQVYFKVILVVERIRYVDCNKKERKKYLQYLGIKL